MVSHIFTTYSQIKNREEIENDLLKPLHLYAQWISPKPENDGNKYTQKLYAETLILMRSEENDYITMVSRAATQQFKTLEMYDDSAPEGYFKTLFAFYVSWFIDTDKEVLIKQPDVDNGLLIKDSMIVNFKKEYPEPRDVLREIWVPFYIKKESEYIKKDYGKLDLGMPIYDMVIIDD